VPRLDCRVTVLMLTFSEWAAAAAGVDVAGLRIAVHDDGDPSGPVVTFLHGYPSSSLDVVPCSSGSPTCGW